MTSPKCSGNNKLPRPGYTLLEVTLALAIALLLLGALYTALYTTAFQTKIGRETIEDSNIARAVLKRITEDISSHLGPVDSRVVRMPQSWQLQSAIIPDEESPEAATNAPYFNLGVQGDNTFLRLYVSQAPNLKSLLKKQEDIEELTLDAFTDLRRITYWVVGAGGSGLVGLAREEIKVATSEEAILNTPPSELPEPDKYILAKEVEDAVFRYFDPVLEDWSDTWDGTMPGDLEGQTPVGPPAAIEIKL